MKQDYTVRVLGALEDAVEEQNIDVLVEFVDGRRFTSTFFTLANIRFLMDRWAVTGESGDRAYFWSSDAIIVCDWSMQAIEGAIQSLIDSGEFGRGKSEASREAQVLLILQDPNPNPPLPFPCKF